jgi:spectrin beta
MQIQRDNLEDALLLHQFLRDVDDELQWVAEKELQASFTDLDTSLIAVQSLQKKHQASIICVTHTQNNDKWS